MNALVGLFCVICAGLVADAFAADPSASKPDGQSQSQPSPVAPLGAVEQSPAAAPRSVTTREAPNTDSSASVKSEVNAASRSTATSPDNANAQPVGHNSVKNVLVDDTVTDAQLRQILAKGYRPTEQESGNEVSYCRREQLPGERFLTTVCKSAARILEDEQRGKDLVSSVERLGLQTGR